MGESEAQVGSWLHTRYFCSHCSTIRFTQHSAVQRAGHVYATLSSVSSIPPCL